MVATKPIDFRKGHDGLAALVKNELHKDPSGLVMACKRLEEHTFTWPAIKDGVMNLGHAQFEALFSGLDWRRVEDDPVKRQRDGKERTLFVRMGR
jgi:transposase